MKNKAFFEAVKYVGFITQLGLSMIVPLLLCIFVTIWLRDKFGLGNFVVLIGIILGILTSFYNLATFIKFATRKANESKDKRDEL